MCNYTKPSHLYTLNVEPSSHSDYTTHESPSKVNRPGELSYVGWMTIDTDFSQFISIKLVCIELNVRDDERQINKYLMCI